GSLPQGSHGPEVGQSPWLAEADPVERSRQARTKISDTLVEIAGDAASDAGSTPAASTKPNALVATVLERERRAELRGRVRWPAGAETQPGLVRGWMRRSADPACRGHGAGQPCGNSHSTRPSLRGAARR